MACGRRRGRRTEEALHPRQTRTQPHQKGHRAHEQSRHTPEVRRATIRLRETPLTFTVTVRRVRINPEKKRSEYLHRLERVIRELNEMLQNPDTIKSTKLKAMDVMIKAVKACYTIVRDVDVEEIEEAVEKIKKAALQPSVDFAPLDDPEGPI